MKVSENVAGLLSAYFIECREKAKFSQQDIADRSSLINTQKTVSRIENSPLDYSLEILLDYITAAGGSLDTFSQLLTQTKSTFTRNEDMTYGEFKTQASNFKNQLSSAISDLGKLPKRTCPEKLITTLKQVHNDLSVSPSKPTIAIMGPSDSGKSHIINLLLGLNIAPEGFQPMTSTSTLFVHVDLKPDSINESVVVFKYENEGHFFNLDRLTGDSKTLNGFIMAEGDFDLIEEYGARDSNDTILYPDAYLAVVYVDSPILKKISLLDTPGQLIDTGYDASSDDQNHPESIDVRKAYEAMGLADAIIFTSSMTKFLRDGEPEFFANVLRAPGNIPLNPQSPLENITILATQAFTVKSISDFEDTKMRAAKSFNREMTNLLYEDWEQQCQDFKCPTEEDWAERIQPFWDDNESLMNAFEKQFDSVVNNTTKTLYERRQNRLNVIKQQLRTALDVEIQAISNKRKSIDERTEEVNAQDARFRRDVDGILAKFESHINATDSYKSNNLSDFRDCVFRIKSQEYMVKFINDRFSGKDAKEKAKKQILNAIGQHLETQTKRIINTASKEYTDHVDSLVLEFESIVPGSKLNVDDPNFKHGRHKLSCNDFDARSAFIGGMAGVSAFGAMSLYVSTVASNLGAYILIGKAAGVLTTLGITSSVTTLPWLVSTTGGPIAWGVMLASALGYLTYRLLSSWQDSLAKSVIKGMKKESSLFNKIEDEISEYWDATKIAVRNGVEGLKEKAEEHIKHLREDAEKSYSTEDLDSATDCLQSVKSSFE